MSVPDLPRAFDSLRKRRRSLRAEIAEIDLLEARLKETRELLVRAMSFVGRLSREEFERSDSAKYMDRFLKDALEFDADELASLTS